MAIHYILVVLIILAIIGVQIYIYKNTKNKILLYKFIFPDTVSSYSIADTDISASEEVYETVTVSQIRINTKNPTLKEICNSLNMYLQKNKGAASDFYLMKDVVERYCDAEEEEISIQQPIPLYLGLMGTMVGIIVGIGFIAFSGGLSSESLMNNITSLMTCVAIAMTASLVGILFTTLISWESKNATTKVEANKNRFYSWLQTELLPVLSGNTVNALYLLQQNLMTFNQTFQTNIEGLDNALSKIVESSNEQVELISLIKDIDIQHVAQANLSVLKELKDCTGEIAVFNKYLHNVSTYLEAVNGLNNNINEHLTRTAAIERMGAFFEREINQVAERERYINEVVAKVDDTLRKTFEQIQDSTKEGILQLRNNSVTEFDKLQKQYAEQKEEFAKILQQQRDEFISHSGDITTVIEEIRSITEIKTVVTKLLESAKDHTSTLSELVSNLKHCEISRLGNVSKAETVIPSPIQFPKTLVYMMAGMVVIIFMAFGLYIYNSFFATSCNENTVPFISTHEGQNISVTMQEGNDLKQTIVKDTTVNIDTIKILEDKNKAHDIWR